MKDKAAQAEKVDKNEDPFLSWWEWKSLYYISINVYTILKIVYMQGIGSKLINYIILNLASTFVVKIKYILSFYFTILLNYIST